MDNASDNISGTAALAVYAKQLGVDEAEAHKPLGTELSDKSLNACKARLQAIKWVFDQVRPRDFTSVSIGFFERLLREQILKTILLIPEKDANNYLGTKDAVEQSLRKAIKVLNLALDELEEVESSGSGGSKSVFYDCLLECTTHLKTTLNNWDVPNPLNKKKDSKATP